MSVFIIRLSWSLTHINWLDPYELAALYTYQHSKRRLMLYPSLQVLLLVISRHPFSFQQFIDQFGVSPTFRTLFRGVSQFRLRAARQILILSISPLAIEYTSVYGFEQQAYKEYTELLKVRCDTSFPLLHLPHANRLSPFVRLFLVLPQSAGILVSPFRFSIWSNR